MKVVGLLLLFLALLQVACPIHAFSVSDCNSDWQSHSSRSSSSSRGTEESRPSFCSFAFAPNGVCIQPAYFVAVEEVEAKPQPTTGTGTGRIGTHVTPEISSTPQPRQAEPAGKQSSRQRYFTLRNVPGTGDCMFLAVALATACSMGLGANDVLLNAIARETREVVAGILEQSLQNTTSNSSSTTLVVTGNRLVTTRAVLRQAARECQLDEWEYLRQLRLTGQDGGLYGGGPELTVLTNVLRRPISIYELQNEEGEVVLLPAQQSPQQDPQSKNIQPIVCKGVFGEGVFADPLRHVPNSAVVNAALQPQGAYSWHLHILVVDSGMGNEKHACVLLPQTPSW